MLRNRRVTTVARDNYTPTMCLPQLRAAISLFHDATQLFAGVYLPGIYRVSGKIPNIVEPPSLPPPLSSSSSSSSSFLQLSRRRRRRAVNSLHFVTSTAAKHLYIVYASTSFHRARSRRCLSYSPSRVLLFTRRRACFTLALLDARPVFHSVG